MNQIILAGQHQPVIQEKHLEILQNSIFKDFSKDEIDYSVQVCNRLRLDPFLKQIIFVKRRDLKRNVDTVVAQIGIDGFRLIADRTGAYAGSDEPVFDNEDKPKKASVTVYKMVQGQRVPFTASARWDEFYPGDALGFMWKSKPCVMLGKCAEAQALRKAFPAELSDVYEPSELERPIDLTAAKEKAAKIEELVEDMTEVKSEQLYQITFGKYSGKTIDEVGKEEALAYADYLKTSAEKKGQQLSGRVLELVQKIEEHFAEGAGR